MSTTRKPHMGREVTQVYNTLTSASVSELQRHIIHHLILPEQFTTARVNYDVRKGIPCDEERYDNPAYYPLKFFSGSNVKEPEEIWVSCCNAGYPGTGPHGTLECLRMMGFNISKEQEEELFGVNRTTDQIHLEFSK